MGPAVLLAVLSAVLGGPRPVVAAVAAASEERPASPAVAPPCWRVEQFVVAQECTRCSGFQLTVPACGPTGFIERINCPQSQREEFKSCRSAALESRRFWRFVGSSVAVAAAAALLVVLRQRELDRRARDKVRKQIESI